MMFNVIDLFAGVAKSSGDTLTPWHLSSDLSLMVFVDPAANTKTIKSLAEIACDTTRTSGITDLSLVDHDVNPKLDVSKLRGLCCVQD